MRATRPPPSRTMRPYARGSCGSKDRTVAAARSRLWVSTRSSSTSAVRSGVSPESTSTSLCSGASRSWATRTASPVPRGSCCTTMSRPSKLSLAPGDVTTTIGYAPAPLAASMTQSMTRRPSSGCRCLGVAERILVPSPAAITTAANMSLICGMAGAPGFEPGIAGPKPAALPLGYAPANMEAAQDRALARGSNQGWRENPCQAVSLTAVGKDQEQRDRREDRCDDQHEEAQEVSDERRQDGQRLRRSGDPRDLSDRV